MSLGCIFQCLSTRFRNIYRDADKSLVRPGRKQATATEDYEFYISYLQSKLEEY